MGKKNLSPVDGDHRRIVIFQEKSIRRAWYNDEWWFSVIDVCAVLTDSADAGAYWRKLKQRLGAEGSEVVTICHGLKLEAARLWKRRRVHGWSVARTSWPLPR